MKGIQQACWALAVVAVLMSGCSGTPQVGTQAKQELRDSAKVKASAYEGAMVYYSLPSPLEVAYIVENSGINYEPGVLHKTELGVRYSTTKSQAINLGIYGSDLSYSILFNQQQVALKYLDCIKELSSGLDVTDTTSIKKLREMEDNIHDKEKLKKIVAQTFFHSDALLKENSRRPTAIMIVAGMWIESLYIATQLSNGNPESNPSLTRCIVEQGLVFDDLLGMLSSVPGNEDVAYIKSKIEVIGSDYDQIKNSLGGTFVFTGEHLTVDAAAFKRICDDIKAVRTEFTELF
ncbi:MAG: hypothetical protein IIT32_05470 [Bacteroidales bacterium]|jgi:hypothetical protein|nr:hypothetical protein [Bacteroidales bacterium]